MSVRGVWLVKPSEKIPYFTRRFPTVERRAKMVSQYCPIPPDKDLVESIVSLTTDREQTFSAVRDSCESLDTPPVMWLCAGKLGPLITLHRAGLIIAALAANQESVPCALVLCEALSELVQTDSHDLKEVSSYLSVCAPFGTPLDLSPVNVSARLKVVSKSSRASSDQQKSPGWSVPSYRGPSRVNICLREEIKAVQYDKPSVADVWQLGGSLYCKTETEGSPDVQLTLSSFEETELQDIVYHHTVHADDAHHHGNQRKVRFCASPESQCLLHYTVSSREGQLPIRGFYQMKGESSVRLLVQLKLNEGMKNNFEFCEVHIPFFNKGVIDNVDSVVPSNLATALSLTKNNKTIIWTIGQKFPVRGLELSLQATVHFREVNSGDSDRPFFVGSNSYIEMFFKTLDYTLSGAFVDPKTVSLFPSNKAKVTISRELYTTSYRIWNSHGDVLATYSQHKAH